MTSADVTVSVTFFCAKPTTVWMMPTVWLRIAPAMMSDELRNEWMAQKMSIYAAKPQGPEFVE